MVETSLDEKVYCGIVERNGNQEIDGAKRVYVSLTDIYVELSNGTRLGGKDLKGYFLINAEVGGLNGNGRKNFNGRNAQIQVVYS